MLYTLFVGRLLWISLLRFIVMQEVVQFYQNFEVSPLPEWTLSVFVYVLYIAVAAVFSLWLWKNRLPEMWKLVSTIVGFIFLQKMLDLLVFKLFTFGTWKDVAGVYTWSTFLFPFLILASSSGLGILATWWYLRRRGLRTAQSNNIGE